MGFSNWIYPASNQQMKGDLIQTYKIVHNIDNLDKDSFFRLNPSNNTRSSHLKLEKELSKSSIRSNFLANRVKNMEWPPGEGSGGRRPIHFQEPYWQSYTTKNVLFMENNVRDPHTTCHNITHPRALSILIHLIHTQNKPYSLVAHTILPVCYVLNYVIMMTEMPLDCI